MQLNVYFLVSIDILNDYLAVKTVSVMKLFRIT